MKKWMLTLCVCAGIGCQTPKKSDIIYKPPIQWEYKIVNFVKHQTGLLKANEPYGPEPSKAEYVFNKLGWSGWEFVESRGRYGVFRRRKH